MTQPHDNHERLPDSVVDPIHHIVAGLGIPRPVFTDLLPPQDRSDPRMVRFVALNEPIPGITYTAPDGTLTRFPSNFDGLIITASGTPEFRDASVILSSSNPTQAVGRDGKLVCLTLEIYASVDILSDSSGIAIAQRETQPDGKLVEESAFATILGEYPATATGMRDFDAAIGTSLHEQLVVRELSPAPPFEGRPEDI